MPPVPNLKSIRERRFLTQKELGDKAGVHEVTIVRLESDSASAQFSTIKKLARALGTSPESLIGASVFSMSGTAYGPKTLHVPPDLLDELGMPAELRARLNEWYMSATDEQREALLQRLVNGYLDL